MCQICLAVIWEHSQQQCWRMSPQASSGPHSWAHLATDWSDAACCQSLRQHVQYQITGLSFFSPASGSMHAWQQLCASFCAFAENAFLRVKCGLPWIVGPCAGESSVQVDVCPQGDDAMSSLSPAQLVLRALASMLYLVFLVLFSIS